MHTKHLTTPTQALYRVFVLPALSPKINTNCHPSNIPSKPHNGRIRSLRHTTQPFSTTATRHAKTRAPVLRKELWDEEITAQQIYLINPETGTVSNPETGEYPKPASRYEILRDLHRPAQRLVQVAPGLRIRPHNKQNGEAAQQLDEEEAEQDSDEGEWVSIPVCKIINVREAYQHAQKQRMQSKEKRNASKVSASIKTLELNWAIDPNDLSHRLERVQEFLEEGRKVEVVLAAKKKGRKASTEECKGVLERIRGVVGNVDGAKEVRDMEGRVGGFAALRFQGKPA
jgi:translation initiation factor IF-3